jgi:C-terminal processing protease CtpA/Prc
MASVTSSRRSVLIALGVVLVVGGAALTYAYRDALGLADPPRDEQIENLRAFATLYGYVRYFHPSDAAAETDWGTFAVYGVRHVRDAASPSDLRAELEALFEPIAPTVRLYRTGNEPPPPADILTPADTAGLHLVAWQHRGVGFSQDNVPGAHRRSRADSLRTYRSLRLNRPTDREPLFEARPAPAETVTKPLGRGLSVQLPLALHSRDGRTLRPEGAPSPAALRDSLGRIETRALDTKPSLRLANVTIAWNVFQHFYPYFEVVDVNWDAVLTRTLRRALADDRSKRALLQTLRRMVAQLEDGHGRVAHPLVSSSGLPVRFGRIEGEIVVMDVAERPDRNPCLDIGDVVVSIDGRSAERRLQEVKRYVSGSPQWTRGRALLRLSRGMPGSTVSLGVRRGGTEKTCEVARTDRRINWRQLRFDDRPDTVDTLRTGVRYVDLTRAKWSALQQNLRGLANADGVVFDLRGYPTRGARKLLGHLSGDTLRSPRFQIPQFIYPDQENMVGYDTRRWTLPPREPQIAGDVAFLTGPGAISYAESIMSIVEHYDLGIIVGQQTAGTNGNINPFELPGGYRVLWTGMRVRTHEGSQHHLVGIQPDVRVERTIDGVRKGRDEVLQAALEVL